MIRNSIEAMGGKGTISIYSNLSKEAYEIYLKDSGPGIPASMLKTIYDPFTSSKENGTGLGLMIVKRILENHHGGIELYNTSEKGTTFLIHLPLTMSDDV